MTRRLTPDTWRLSYDSDRSTRVNVEDAGELDEVVVGNWLHLERLNDRAWGLKVGDARISVTVDRGGRARVNVYRGEFAEVSGETMGGKR